MSRHVGRDAVRRALVGAATRLYARRGPAAVSVRDIATKAGVNHGLVHRHFGSKDGLTTEVMRTLVDALRDDLGPDDDADDPAPALARMLEGVRRHPTYWQILARALLDGTDPRRLQATFPVVARLRALLERRGPGPFEPAALTAIVVAAGLGLVAFGPFVRVAVGMSRAQWDELVESLPYRLAAALPAAR